MTLQIDVCDSIFFCMALTQLFSPMVSGWASSGNNNLAWAVSHMRVLEVDTLQGHRIGDLSVNPHDVTFI